MSRCRAGCTQHTAPGSPPQQPLELCTGPGKPPALSHRPGWAGLGCPQPPDSHPAPGLLHSPALRNPVGVGFGRQGGRAGGVGRELRPLGGVGRVGRLLGHGRPPLGPPCHRASPRWAPHSPVLLSCPAGPGRACRIGVPGGLSQATPQRVSGDLPRQGGTMNRWLLTTHSCKASPRTRTHGKDSAVNRPGPDVTGNPANVACSW